MILMNKNLINSKCSNYNIKKHRDNSNNNNNNTVRMWSKINELYQKQIYKILKILIYGRGGVFYFGGTKLIVVDWKKIRLSQKTIIIYFNWYS